MVTPIPVTAPAGAVPELALAFAARDGSAATVSLDNPLPVTPATAPAASTPVSGSASASTVAGPFRPDLGRPIWVTLSGNWTGSVSLLRSTDGGATRLPLTVAGQPWGNFTGNGQEPVVEEGAADASYYLAATLSSGTLSFRVAQ